MNRFLGILAVILFWVLALSLSPVIIVLGVLIFLLSMFLAISSLVYDLSVSYLERKKR